MQQQLSPKDIPDDVLTLCRELDRHGYRAWVVGGCLRDVLREKPAADWDLATDARPEEVRRVFTRVIPTGIQHGTVTVRLHGKSYEVTTLRGEGAYSDGRRPDAVQFVTEIEADLGRRDFTVNAIAYDPLQGRMCDPYGGLEDIEKGIIRAVGDPSRRFSEDGLRVLRAARFAATLEYALDPETEAAIGPNLDTFRRVSAERVRDEWLKALKAHRPSLAFAVMARTGMLAVTAPLLASLPPATWTQALTTLDAAGPVPLLRLSALFHPVTDLAAMAEWLATYRFSNADREHALLLLHHHTPRDVENWTDGDVRRHARRVGRDAVHEAAHLGCLIARARRGGGSLQGQAAQRLSERLGTLITPDTPLTGKELSVRGHDLMQELALPAGPELGRILDHLLDAVLDDPALNTRATLLTLASRRGQEG